MKVMNFIMFKDFSRIFLNFMDLFLLKNIKKWFLMLANMADNMAPCGNECTRHMAHTCV